MMCDFIYVSLLIICIIHWFMYNVEIIPFAFVELMLTCPYSDSLIFHTMYTSETITRAMLVVELNLVFCATLRFFKVYW
jgi:hypothetical protein